MENKFAFVLLSYDQTTQVKRAEIDKLAMVDCGCDGIEDFSLEEARVDEILGERAYSGGDVPETLLDEVEEATFATDLYYIKYYFSDISEAEDFVFILKDRYSNIPFVIETKAIEDWNKEWRKYYTPIIISEKFEVIPEWLMEKFKDDNKKQIIIYPGMGFGTGTHETTFLCLKLFEKHLDKIQGNRCLDFGCGSGILGIGAILLKQMQVEFVDIDRSALDNSYQNLSINFDVNSLEGSSLVIRDRYLEKSFDLIFANILENVLELEHQAIVNSSKAGTVLIVSGLLNHQVPNIIKTYAEYNHVETIQKGDWSAVLFVKK